MKEVSPKCCCCDKYASLYCIENHVHLCVDCIKASKSIKPEQTELEKAFEKATENGKMFYSAWDAYKAGARALLNKFESIYDFQGEMDLPPDQFLGASVAMARTRMKMRNFIGIKND